MISSELKETSQFIGWSVMKENQLTWMMFPLRAGCTMTGLSGMITIQPSLLEVRELTSFDFIEFILPPESTADPEEGNNPEAEGREEKVNKW